MSVIADNLSVKYGCEGLEPTNSDGWWIPLFVTAAEAQTLLAGYDPANKYSPNADESREIARVFLDALKAASGS